MRSYFNKPSWASRGDDDGNSEFYRRAPQTYQDIVATNLSARERHAKSVKTDTHKRRRLSKSSDVEDTQISASVQETAAEAAAPVDNSQNIPENSTDSSKSPTKDPPSTSKASSTKPAESSVLPTPRDSPEGKLPNSRPDSTKFSPVDTTTNNSAGSRTGGRSEGQKVADQTETSHRNRKTAYDNTVVQILITSKIAETKPLIVHRKMSQSLKGVRLAWCLHQKMPKEQHSSVFLTWKGRRLFDVTTCRSLNLNSRTALTENLSPFDDCFEDKDDYRIHMEAVTEEIFAAGHRTLMDMDKLESPFKESTAVQGTEEHARSEIILKCPGRDDFKLRVPITTRVSQIVGAFREAESISAELVVYLTFDGDRLDPQSCLSDHDIADGDLLDVLVKAAG